MNLDEYQKAALRTASHIDTFEVTSENIRILRGVLGVCGEGSEMLEHMKKVMFQGHPMNRIKILKELGDTLWYCAYLAEALDTPLGDVAFANLNKLSQRYPEGHFTKERSVQR